MKEKKEDKNIHNYLWAEIKNLCLKYGAITILISIGVVEFFRKFRLHQLGVPLFVFDSEPLITHYSYGKTILSAFLYLPGLGLFIIGIEYIMLCKKWFKKLLSFIIFILGFILFIIGFIVLFTYLPPKGETIYFSKDYQVSNIKGEIRLKMGDKVFKCLRPSVFEDICIEKK